MTFVADFTPEQLQNASAGRRYGQRKREAQEAQLRRLELALKEMSLLYLSTRKP